jgi:hypothetical protein
MKLPLRPFVGALVLASTVFTGCGPIDEQEPLAPDSQESRPVTPEASMPAGQVMFVPLDPREVRTQAVGDTCYLCGNNVSNWCFIRGYWKSPNWRYVGTYQYQNGVYGCLAYTNNWECTNSC